VRLRGAPLHLHHTRRATVVAGGSSVSFTATLVDTNGLVSWTLTGPGTFNPLGGSGALYAPPASVPSPTDATLSASSGTLVAHVTIGVNPTPGITRTFTTR